jgi:hypothetical protein
MPEYRSTIPLHFALDVMSMWEAWNVHKGPSSVHKKLAPTTSFSTDVRDRLDSTLVPILLRHSS